MTHDGKAISIEVPHLKQAVERAHQFDIECKTTANDLGIPEVEVSRYARELSIRTFMTDAEAARSLRNPRLTGWDYVFVALAPGI